MAQFMGTVVNGVVVFDGGGAPPEGTRVDVSVSESATTTPKSAPTGPGPHAWMLEFAGKVTDLPPDFADQHDHYIHGTPKR